MKNKSKITYIFLTTFFSFLQSQPMKEWTFAVYIAADNDLNYFAGKNLDDMAKVGSNHILNIVAHLDRQGAYERTKRVYVEKNKITQVSYASQKIDSGSASALIDFYDWVVKNYPAKHYALILWNHGSGICDSVGGRTINPSELFIFNPQTNMLELDRSISYLTYLQQKAEELRGICFSDTFNSFLTNQKLDYALRMIVETNLHKKIDIIGYDACLMGMLEVANLIEPYADIAVFSEEIEMGAGWKYDEVLKPFLTQTLSPEEFARHIVTAYSAAYTPITNDFTLSAIALEKTKMLEKSLHEFSNLMIEALQYQQGNSLFYAIRASRSKKLCTHFSEPSYIDLDHFLTNIFDTMDYVNLAPEGAHLKNNIKQTITQARKHLENCVISHVEGKNLKRARGLSIYFPLGQLDPTYPITPFALSNAWINFINLLL